MKKHAVTLFACAALWSVALAAAQSVEVIEETGSDRLIRHVLGETRIPAQPERVVSLTSAVTEGMVALGLPLAGATPTADGGHSPYLADDLAAVPMLGGDEYSLNLEAILALQPDLILLYAFEGNLVTNVQYEQLNRIAPTVALDWQNLYSDFRTGFLELGAVLGVPERAEARLAEYEQKLARTKEAVQAVVGDDSVALLRVRQTELRLHGGVGLVGPFLYHDLGLEPAALVREVAMDEEFATISPEVVPRIDADYLLLAVSARDPEGQVTLQELQASNL